MQPNLTQANPTLLSLLRYLAIGALFKLVQFRYNNVIVERAPESDVLSVQVPG